MDYKTDVLHIDRQFPFAVYHGTGYTVEEFNSGKTYMHRHQSLEINYCLSGNGWYDIGEQTYEINKGDLFIINDLEYHQAVNKSGDMQLLVIVFESDLVLSDGEDYALIRAFYEWKTGFKHRIAADSPILEDIAPLLLEMDREWQKQEVGYKMVLKALLMKLLAMLYRSFEKIESYTEQIRRFQNGYIRLAPAIVLIESNFREQITLEQLADCVHMNRNYFSTLFTSLMGSTVSEYIIRRRMRNAVQLLIGTDNSIISVAMDSGFRNVSYFNRAFHKQFGVSPGGYRENARKSRLEQIR